MKPMTSSWIGRWRLVETDLWSDDVIDLLEPAYIELRADRLGSFVVGALQADLDYRVGERDGHAIIEFSWEGDDDGHPASGRGSAQLDAARAIQVKLFIHHGDDVAMVGQPVAPPPKPLAASSKPARRGARRPGR